MFTEQELQEILNRLLALPAETELVEFKESKNSFDNNELGKYFSAISNEANLRDLEFGWLIFGVDSRHKIVGTQFKLGRPSLDELKKTIADNTIGRHTFIEIYELNTIDGRVVMFQIPSASKGIPVSWKGHFYSREGESIVPIGISKLEEIRNQVNSFRFERELALKNLAIGEVLEKLDYLAVFTGLGLPRPTNDDIAVERLCQEKLVRKNGKDLFDITNLGALLYARHLPDFPELARKAVRVIIYEGYNKLSTIKEQVWDYGYAVGFKGLIDYINDQIPQHEVIGRALRESKKMFPFLAIRELVANAIIHQDFGQRGTSPMVEIYSDRIEIINNGRPLIDTQRFIDEPPQSRNEDLASYMRRLNYCEERGSGIDKVVNEVELAMLPAPRFEVTSNHTKVILFAYRELSDISMGEKIQACYQHACLLQVSSKSMTNQSLRQRFGVTDANYPIVSRIIKETLNMGLIKHFDPHNKSPKYASYIPHWA